MNKDEVKEIKKEEDDMKIKEKEEVYSRDELISYSKEIFGVNPEIVEGALSGIPKREFTIKEVKNHINQFLRRRVK